MPLVTRGALAYLVLTGFVVGVWAFGFPHAFYAGFPGFGRTWVSVDGPFNEHLVRDTGAAYLMTAGLGAVGWTRPAIAAPFTVGVATLCFNLPHFAYHMTHLGMYGLVDRALNVAALGSAVLASAWLLTPYARTREMT